VTAFRDEVWAFDAEWVPDAELGRRLYRLAPDAPDRAVFEEMWRRGGADEENPRPYLKTVLCRIVSLVALRRSERDGAAQLSLSSWPEAGQGEAAMIGGFLDALGSRRPLLVGFNSRHADLPILIQRAVAHGVAAREFARLDYLGWKSGLHVDLMAELGPGGRGAPSLDELATACGIPGKMATRGGDVADLWLEGRVSEIVAYNELDVVSTWLLWLRLAHFQGRIDSRVYAQEQERVQAFLEAGSAARPQLRAYLECWRSLGSPRSTPAG
jgi:predicted PolB exonuclease-like 3'-5' exonuclease